MMVYSGDTALNNSGVTARAPRPQDAVEVLVALELGHPPDLRLVAQARAVVQLGLDRPLEHEVAEVYRWRGEGVRRGDA